MRGLFLTLATSAIIWCVIHGQHIEYSLKTFNTTLSVSQTEAFKFRVKDASNVTIHANQAATLTISPAALFKIHKLLQLLQFFMNSALPPEWQRSKDSKRCKNIAPVVFCQKLDQNISRCVHISVERKVTFGTLEYLVRSNFPVQFSTFSARHRRVFLCHNVHVALWVLLRFEYQPLLESEVWPRCHGSGSLAVDASLTSS